MYMHAHISTLEVKTDASV